MRINPRHPHLVVGNLYLSGYYDTGSTTMRAHVTSFTIPKLDNPLTGEYERTHLWQLEAEEFMDEFAARRLAAHMMKLHDVYTSALMLP